MLDQTIRQTILTLRDAGNGIRAIARALGVSRVAVKRVLAEGQASPPQLERAEKAEPYRDEICRKLEQGLTAQRIWQDLIDEYGFAAKYQTECDHCVELSAFGSLQACQRQFERAGYFEYLDT